MITTSEVVEKIIREYPFMSHSLTLGLINYSALARKIKPEVEKKLERKVTEGALIMSLKRLTKKVQPDFSISKVLKESPDMIVRSNLVEFTFANSETMVKNQKEFLKYFEAKKQFYLTVTKGFSETTIITSQELEDKIKEIFEKEKISSQFDNLSSITIKFSKDIIAIPGVISYISSALAWEAINIMEVVSTYTEFTVIINTNQLEKAFSILKSLFAK